MPEAADGKKRTRSMPVSLYKLNDQVKIATQGYCAEDSVKIIGIPICFWNTHWRCVIVGKQNSLVSTFNFNSTQSAMSILADQIEELVHDSDFTTQRVQSPVQPDGYSCGFLVCYKFWRAWMRLPAAIYLPPVSLRFASGYSSIFSAVRLPRLMSPSEAWTSA
jgi:hypothetical protein